MRICFAIQGMSLGGSATVVHDIIMNWPNKTDELFLVVFFNSFSERYNDLYDLPYLKIILLDKRKTMDLPFLKRLKNAINHINPDVISSHLTTTFYLKLVGVTKKCRIFHTIHSEPINDLPKIYRLFIRSDIKKGRIRLIGCCEYISNQAFNVYNVPCLTISNRINKSPAYSKNSNKIRFLFVGRLCEVKNVVEMIDCFESLTKDFSFTIVGYGTKKYEDRVKDAILSNKNRDKIQFVGKADNIDEYYLNSDILILVSKREGLPITVLEGITYGLGFVVNDVGGIRDYVKENENGVFLKDNDLFYLPKTLSYLIENPQIVYRFKTDSMSKSDTLSAKKMSEEYLEVLKNG